MTPATGQHAPRRSRRGLTLVEMVLSLTILSTLLLAMNGVVFLAAKTIPDGRTRASAATTAARALDAMANDIRFATEVISSTATSLEITTADMDGNGMADRVRYSWAGTAGAPLVRQYARGDTATNAYTYAPATVVCAEVQDLGFGYDTRKSGLPAAYTTSAEQQFFAVNGLLSLDEKEVTNSKAVGQYFKPTLPSNAVSWAVTRVTFQVKSDGSTAGQSVVQLLPATASGLPTGRVLDQVVMSESVLSTTFANYSVGFTNATGLAPDAGACLTIKWITDAKSCRVQYQKGINALFGTNLINSADGGITYTSSTLDSMSLDVFGTVTTSNPTGYAYTLTGVRLKLRTTTDTTTTAYTTVRVVNEPPVAGP